MAVQTRAQLDTKSNTVKSETAPSAGSIFSASDYTIYYTGSITVGLRVSCQLTFAGTNNRRYSFWIAQNGNIIPQSLSENTTQGTHNHVICLEAFVLASTDNSFEIFASSNSGDEINIKTATFTACTI